MVSRLRNGLAELFALPDGYEVLLGNGGTTVFWDAATFGLIERRSQHLSFGEFSSKFAERAAAAPHLDEPSMSIERARHPSEAGRRGGRRRLRLHPQRDLDRRGHDPERAEGADDDALVVVDATSAAGGLRFDPTEVDVYYFAPQKCLASDGGLWLAACSPGAIERIERIAACDRWVPASLDLGIALDNSRKDQTYNTPALATIFLAVQQVEWINDNGGLEWAAGRCDRSAETIYSGPRRSSYATPFVADPSERSHVVATIDLDDRIDATTVSRRAAAQRHRRHRVATASSAATSSGSPCSRPSSPPTSPRSPAASTTSSPRWLIAPRLAHDVLRRRSALDAHTSSGVGYGRLIGCTGGQCTTAEAVDKSRAAHRAGRAVRGRRPTSSTASR